jgi:cell shape-determining protein MreC
MIYRQDNNQRAKKKLFAFLLIVFFFSIFAATPLSGLTAHMLQRFAPFLWNAGNSAASSFTKLSSVFTSKAVLVNENEALKNQIRDMSLKLLDRNLLYEENLTLKEKTGRSGFNQTITARVLAKPPQSIYDTLIIDVGSNEGVKVGERVLYGDNIVVGEIAEVFETTSKVKLFTSPGESIDVVIGKQAVPAVATGYGSGNFEIKIPRDISVSEGDPILVPNIMPHILGVVEYIESKQSDPFKYILFKSPISPFEIETVEVLTGI